MTPAQDGGRRPLPGFLYVTHAMAEALLGAPLARPSQRGARRARRFTAASRSTTCRAPARNVVAILPGSDPKLKGEYVAIGAHNDHIGFNHAPVDHDSLRAFNAVVRPQGEDDPDAAGDGRGEREDSQILDSLRKMHPPRLDSIYNGADDDGSGTVAVLEIAEAFAKSATKPKRSLLFVWHAGEEKGLWGSEYFTDHPTVPRDSIVAQLNMDMIGRGGAAGREGRRAGLSAADRLAAAVDRARRPRRSGRARREPTPFHFDYQFDANGHPQQYYCRSDHYEYARYGIPIVFFSTGGHRDYHQVTDEPQYIDYDQLARVAHARARRGAPGGEPRPPGRGRQAEAGPEGQCVQ